MTKRKVAMLINENAGKKYKPSRLAAKIAAMLSDDQIMIHRTRRLEEIPRVTAAIKRYRPNMLIWEGGDGTVQANLTEYMRTHSVGAVEPEIFISPDGTQNLVANSCRRYGDNFESQTERMLAKLENNLTFDTVLVHPLKVNAKYGFIYGAGFPVNILIRYYDVGKEDRGPIRAVEVILAAFFDELLSLMTFNLRKSKRLIMKPVRARISLPGQNPDRARLETHTGIIAATVDQMGLGCRAMPNAMRHPGMFMLRSTDISFWGLLRHLRKIKRGRPVPSMDDHMAKRIVIEYLEPSFRTIDGEIIPPPVDGPHTDTIECGPPLKIITG